MPSQDLREKIKEFNQLLRTFASARPEESDKTQRSFTSPKNVSEREREREREWEREREREREEERNIYKGEREKKERERERGREAGDGEYSFFATKPCVFHLTRDCLPCFASQVSV